MNDIFDRMKALLENAGLIFNEKTPDFAELWAYSGALESVKESLEKIENVIFMLCDDKESLAYWCDLLHIDMSRYDKDELSEEIKRRLGLKFAAVSEDDMNKYFDKTDGTYTIDNNSVTISGLKLSDLKEAGKFIKAYAPCFSRATYTGSGDMISWDMWDKSGFTFHGYDSLDLPWEFLDSLRSDIF